MIQANVAVGDRRSSMMNPEITVTQTISAITSWVPHDNSIWHFSPGTLVRVYL